MLRRLTLLRHAKSSWQESGVSDHDRPLNQRGERDAPVMGRRLLARGARPSLILCSTALRARHTAQIIARELGYPAEFLQREPELYLATPEQIMAVIARQADSFRNIIVCGHNPGLTELANRLTGSDIDNIPTCGLVEIELNLASWADIAAASGTRQLYDYPKKG
ncbi:MAG: histidine phosphatase family protein [Gammaproteobacteria bacterium]|jgi:phosphohistidine phosphatase|nr:histidine phosphatase family protein [Gammaproteobacteria bacterium]